MGATLQTSNSSSKRRRHRAAAMGEINITPFVDVMLVLLIIFMVAAPLLITGVDVNLPQSAAGELKQTEDEPITITVQQDGSIFINQTPVSENEFVTKMSANTNKDAKIIMNADQNVDYGLVMRYVGLANSAGFNSFAFATIPVKE